jgi:hypothetical protein
VNLERHLADRGVRPLAGVVGDVTLASRTRIGLLNATMSARVEAEGERAHADAEGSLS